MIKAAAEAELGHPIKLSAQTVHNALDPSAGVMRRAGIGSPALQSIRTTIEATTNDVIATEGRLAERRAASRKLDPT